MDKSAMLQSLVDHYCNGNKRSFSRLLDIPPTTLSTWFARGSFDAELIYDKCRNVSAHWLLTGTGPMIELSYRELIEKLN